MNWELEASLGGRALVATLLGAVVGWERGRSGHQAGVRTFAAVALGSCVFGLVSQHAGDGDHGRIAAQVVTGIGFLGAGCIIRDQGRVRGLTTAANLWGTAAVGLAVAYRLYILSGIITAVSYVLLAVPQLPGYEKLTTDGDKNKEGEA